MQLWQDQLPTDELTYALARILWIGDGTDADKSAVAALLAERNGVQVYHFDRSSGAAERIGREKDPRMFEWIEMSDDI